MSIIFVITSFFPLMTLLEEIIELYLQKGIFFLKTLMRTLHKETKNKVPMLKIGISCYFYSSPRGVFRTLLST